MTADPDAALPTMEQHADALHPVTPYNANKPPGQVKGDEPAALNPRNPMTEQKRGMPPGTPMRGFPAAPLIPENDAHNMPNAPGDALRKRRPIFNRNA